MLQAGHGLYSISEVKTAIDGGKKVRDIVQEYLNAIAELDKTINAIVSLNPRALEDADELDQLDLPRRGPLHGVPIMVKDQIETAGIATTFGSKCCKDFIPSDDATLVKKLRDAGAIILGKSTMPDWAASFFSSSSISGLTQNPYDLTRETGGSSSGSAAAVAAGMAVVAIGGDTGGSIRLPCSFCGLVGVRVTPGRISRHGMSSLVTTQDTPGPMTRTVEDAAQILDVLVGFDEQDEYSSINVIKPCGSFTQAVQKPTLKGKRLGVLKQAFGDHPGVQKVMGETLSALTTSGAEVIDVTVAGLEQYPSTTSVYALRSRGDIDAFLASRQGLSHLTIKDIHANGDYHKALDLIDAIVQGRPDFENDPLLAARLLEQRKFQRVVASVFAKQDLDAIVYPTSQLPAPKTDDVLNFRWTCLSYPTNTIIASQLLFPAISVPVGMCGDHEVEHSADLPVGLEILGLPLQEERILAVAAGVEQARSKALSTFTR